MLRFKLHSHLDHLVQLEFLQSNHPVFHLDFLPDNRYLNNLVTKWPRETFSGFMVHFTNRNMEALSEFSTIDTSILVLGALQAANYFGGEAAALAAQLRAAVRWSDAIYAADNAGLAATVDPGSGAHGGWVAPFNEYYLVAYLANMTEAAAPR